MIRTRLKQWACGWGIAFAGAAVMTTAAAAAETPDATLYDVTEVMRIVGTRPQHRVAEGALAGTAKLGTPFCPEKLASKLPEGATECWIIADGGDDINLVTAQGTLAATITPVTTGDNPFAAPELAHDRITVEGRIDFSPALGGLPYGTVEGRVDRRHRFTGVFLQPFLASAVEPTSGLTLRQIFCPASPAANASLGGPDYAWLEVVDGAPTGRCIDVQPNQMALGFPTLRFDLFFQETRVSRGPVR